MNIPSLTASIEVYNKKEFFGIFSDIMVPFMEAYIKHPVLHKCFPEYKLFNYYHFRVDILRQGCMRTDGYNRIYQRFDEEYYISELIRSPNMFIGYRAYKNLLVPFFISLTRFAAKDGECVISGFSTWTNESWDSLYYSPDTTLNLSTYEKTKDFMKDLKINDDERYYLKSNYRHDDNSTIDNIIKAAKETHFYLKEKENLYNPVYFSEINVIK